MISPEVLRRYPFFGFLTEEQYKKVAMVADEVSWKSGSQIIQVNAAADSFYVLMDGGVELRYFVEDTTVSHKSKDFSVGEVNPGEPFGLSALLDSGKFTANAIAVSDSKGIKIEAGKVLELVKQDPSLGYGLMKAVAKSAFERLDHVRVQWVAASN